MFSDNFSIIKIIFQGKRSLLLIRLETHQEINN